MIRVLIAALAKMKIISRSRRPLTALISLVAILQLTAASDISAQERERIRVSTLFIGSSLVPFWIGQEQGIFAKHGIDLELIWMQSVGI